VVGGPEPEPVREPVDRALERRIVERDQLAATLAQEVVVMLTGGIGELVPRDAIADVESVDEVVFLEQLQHSVDAGTTDPALATATKCVLDLKRAQSAVLAGEQLDQLVARRPFVMAGPMEHGARVGRPI
jgi:hypothetical protein